MRLLYSVIIASMCLSCASSAQEKIDFGNAHNTIDLTKCTQDTLSLDGMYTDVNRISIDWELKHSQVPFTNMQIGNSLFLLEENVFSIETGKKIRNLSPNKFQEALFSGEPALDPSSAIIDNEGRFLYASGSKVEGVIRCNYIEKIDFSTGEVIDSIPIASRYKFDLGIDNNLIIAEDYSPLNALIKEYDLILPESYLLYFAPRHSKSWIWFICWSNKEKEFRHYLFDKNTQKVSWITDVVFDNKIHPVAGLLGFSNQYLGYLETETNSNNLEVVFFKLNKK